MKSARAMCDVGIYEKFNQNEYLKQLLLSTADQKIVEACKDKDWGCGMSLYDDRCLVERTWYSQGLLGTILEEVRHQLKNIDIEGDNTEVNRETAMDAEEAPAASSAND